MRIAVEGCCHGQLDAIYKRIEQLEKQHDYKVDLLLICGDFQAMRTQADLSCMAVPQKYLELGDFPKYYSGERVSPILTVIIGGNHEASNYMWELYHGGFLAPNMYYLGAAGVVQVNGLRIAGASGIYKYHDFNLGHYEKLPYDRSSMRSIYHIRHYDVAKLLQIRSPDIFLSHDWPCSIEKHGDVNDLFRRKPFFREDSAKGTLGSPPLWEILKTLRPQRWFAAHLHVKFHVDVYHGEKPPQTKRDRKDKKPKQAKAVPNPDEIQISFDDDEGIEESEAAALIADPVEAEPEPEPESTAPVQEPASSSNAPQPTTGVAVTHFLALDKCLPKRDYLEIVDVESPLSHNPPLFTFDNQWLAITRAMHGYLSLERRAINLPPPATLDAEIKESVAWVNVKHDNQEKEISSVQTFCMTSPGVVSDFRGKNFPQPSWYTNPQTVAYCEMLEIENKINPPPLSS